MIENVINPGEIKVHYAKIRTHNGPAKQPPRLYTYRNASQSHVIELELVTKLSIDRHHFLLQDSRLLRCTLQVLRLIVLAWSVGPGCRKQCSCPLTIFFPPPRNRESVPGVTVDFLRPKSVVTLLIGLFQNILIGLFH